MRRWLTDRLRLAVRKVLPRLYVFALMPTQQEWDQITGVVVAAMKEASAPQSDSKLH